MISIAAIADGVVTAINGATLPQTVVAARRYIPNKGVLDLGGYDVMVVPKGAELTRDTRALTRKPVDVDIAIRKKVASDATADCDPVLALAEAIAEGFIKDTIAVPNCPCIEVKYAPIYSVEVLKGEQVFFTLVTVTLLAHG